MLDDELEIVVLRKCSELQENTERQFNNIRKTIHEQSNKFNKDIAIIKKNQKEMLELKNTIKVMKNAMKNINRRLKKKKESMNFKIGYLKLSS